MPQPFRLKSDLNVEIRYNVHILAMHFQGAF